MEAVTRTGRACRSARGDPGRLPAARAASRTASRSSIVDNAATVAEAGERDRGDLEPTTATRTRTSTAACTSWPPRRPRSTRARGRASRSFIGARAEEIVFVRNATEAINLVRFTWAARGGRGRRHRASSRAMEHHSNVVPWQLLCEERGARLEYVEIDGEGRLDLDDARRPAPRQSREAGRGRPRLERARNDQPGRRDLAPRARRRREGADRRRPGACPSCRSTSARPAPTSTPSPGTRCSGRRASASSGRGASCSRRCRRSWAAAR